MIVHDRYPANLRGKQCGNRRSVPRGSILRVCLPEALAEEQPIDVELSALLQGTTALQFEKIPFPGSEVTLHCDTSATRQNPKSP
jgi:hypothetical protein